LQHYYNLDPVHHNSGNIARSQISPMNFNKCYIFPVNNSTMEDNQ